MKPRALVVLNPGARQGTAEARFAGVKPTLRSRFDVAVVRSTPDEAWHEAVRSALDDGVRVFVAAGEDGTVHGLVQALLDARGDAPLDDLRLGAVGLGSSNDFHKTRDTEHPEELPLRLDLHAIRPRTVLRVRRDDLGPEVVVVSASLGVTADGNARFNNPGPVLRLLKRTWTDGAIAHAALSAVLGWKDVPVELTVDTTTTVIHLTNLSMLLTPWLSGTLRYDLPVDACSDTFVVALAHDRTVLERLALLARLARGRFAGTPGTRWCRARRLHLRAEEPLAVELDGEVAPARALEVALHPHSLPVLGEGVPGA